MATSIRKIGNSQGVILPKPALQALGVAEGGLVEFVYEPGKISIVPAQRPVREGWEEDAKAIAAAGSVGDKRVIGGTAPERVREEIRRWKKDLSD